jgi:hypothetical protein
VCRVQGAIGPSFSPALFHKTLPFKGNKYFNLFGGEFNGDVVDICNGCDGVAYGSELFADVICLAPGPFSYMLWC